MSKLGQLIEELCPNGVEHVKLGEVCDIYDGTHQTPTYTSEGIRFVSVENIFNLKQSKKCISPEDFERLYKNKPKKNDVFMTRIGSIGICAIVEDDEPLAYYVTLTLISPNREQVNSGFLKHAIESINGSNELRKRTLINATPIKINLGDIGKIKIPLPPLPVQEEIVRILDDFTGLTSELKSKLTSELTLRKQQYEYYRDTLLTFGDNVEINQFGKTATIARGASPRPINNFTTNLDNGINWIKIGDVSVGDKYITSTKEKITEEGAKKSRFVKKGDFVLSNSMSFGRPYILAIDGCIHDGWLSISNFENNYISDFLYHLLSSNKYQTEMARKASFGGAVQNLNADIVKSLAMPIPSLPDQQRIVEILDCFDTLTNDITKDLLVEIEARQLQYEYYRNKLLTFKEVDHE